MVGQAVRVACVTGATGVVGKWVVRRLIELGWRVRILTRRENISVKGAEVFSGDLMDIALLEKFISGADAIFHCAAELNNQAVMHQTNVIGTKNLLKVMENEDIGYLCHLSSVGVMGGKLDGVVTESEHCLPSGSYENSKFDAEKLVLESRVCEKTIILRPTNVVDKTHLGILEITKKGILNRIRLLLKGAENAHLVHACDVANAAVYFLDKNFLGNNCYILSMDEQVHTVGQVCSHYRTLYKKAYWLNIYLPWRMIFFLRNIFRGDSLKGNVIFSSEKIRKNGYKFTHNPDTLLIDIAEHNELS